MKKFEYETKLVRIWKRKLDDADLKETLNKMGQGGWELVSTESDSQDVICIFKRELI